MSQNKKIKKSLFEKAIGYHQKQQWSQAINAYKKIIKKTPNDLPALINLATIYKKQKKLDYAKEYFQRAVNTPNPSLEAWYNFGNCCVEQKDWQQAEHCFQQVLNFNPDYANAYYQIANIATAQGHWQKAVDHYQHVINLLPEAESAYLDQGNAYRHLGKNEQSLACFQQIIRINPDSWKGHYSLARLYSQSNQSNLFEQHYQLSLKLVDQPWFIHYNLAMTWFDHADFAGAAQQYELAIKAAPDQMTSYIGLGATYIHLRQTNKAKQLFQQVSQSEDVSILSHLARIIWEYKFFDEAIAVLEKMVALRPELYDTHLNLAKACSQNWQLSRSIQCLQTSLKINPNCQEAQDLLANIYVKQGRCDESVALYQQQVERENIFSSAVSSLLFTILYSTSYTAQQKADKHIELMKKWTNELAEPTEFKNSLNPDKKIRIGYISADFRDQHPVGLFLQPILNFHDKSQFEIYAYYNTRTYDDSTYAIKEQVDQWFDVAEWSDERLKHQIMQHKVDILVDLAGHTAKNRLRLFARRAAPVQLSWLGYPHSTGLSTIDYYLTDKIVSPEDQQSLYAEQVIRLESHCVFCYPPDDSYGEVDFNKSKQRPQVILGSFNNLTKVNQSTLHLWLKVMQSIPEVLLKLKTPSFTDKVCLNQVRSFFTNNNIDSQRLIFTGPSSLDSMMREYNDVDIALDPIPFNGGTTSMQALWMGVPVISIKGDNFCGRMGASMMHFLGLDDWIAESEEQYIEIVKEKVRQRDQLLTLKSTLRQRMLESPLCDTRGFTTELEQVFKKIWRQYCNKP